MRSILFVDDEPNILDGLRLLLRVQRREWEMVFAQGGPAGLEEIGRRRFDVVVSDMRMPIVDGAELLTRVKEVQPRAVRLVLSGQTDVETAMRTVFVAHQYLSKPCDVATLRGTIARACALNDLVQDDALKAAAGDVSMLPPAPGVYFQLTKVTSNPNSGVKDAAAVVESDVGLVAKILQVVNSAFFALPRKVTSVSEAASLLGTTTLKNLSLALEVFNKAKSTSPEALRALQQHSLLTANVARQIVGAGDGDRKRADAAFVAGMLHDVGRLVGAERRGLGRDDVEVHHAHLGAYLLGIWGLPFPVIEAVALHHPPLTVPLQGYDTLVAVHVASALVEERLGAHAGLSDGAAGLDRTVIAALGLDAELPGWRQTAADEAARTAAAA